MKMFRKDEGFTLVELMVVVLIIGILVAIAVPVFLNASASAQAKSCQGNQRIVVGAIQTYNATNTGAAAIAAATTEYLGGAETVALFNATTGTIKSIPKCPSNLGAAGHTGEYTVGTAASGATNVVLSDQGSLTATGITADFIATGSGHKLP